MPTIYHWVINIRGWEFFHKRIKDFCSCTVNLEEGIWWNSELLSEQDFMDILCVCVLCSMNVHDTVCKSEHGTNVTMHTHSPQVQEGVHTTASHQQLWDEEMELTNMDVINYINYLYYAMVGSAPSPQLLQEKRGGSILWPLTMTEVISKPTLLCMQLLL